MLFPAIGFLFSACLLFIMACAFGSIRGSDLFIYFSPLIVLPLLIAIAIAGWKTGLSRKILIFLFLLPSIPVLILGLFMIFTQKSSNELAMDRLKEQFVSPIPNSVSDVKFVKIPTNSKISLKISFKISATDFNDLLTSKGFSILTDSALDSARANLDDRFKIGNSDVFYGGKSSVHDFLIRADRESNLVVSLVLKIDEIPARNRVR